MEMQKKFTVVHDATDRHKIDAPARMIRRNYQRLRDVILHTGL